MTTFSLNPTYYQVTWSDVSPNDYSSLGANQAGGLDSTTALNYNRLVHVTGTTAVTTNVMTDGETLIINGYSVVFDSSMNLAAVISAINLATKFTGVIADQRTASTYITLANAPGQEGAAFYIAEGNGSALSKLGLTADTYQYYPNIVGGTFTSVGTGDNVTINGINIVFTAGNLASVVSQLNAYTPTTSVAALPAADKLQLTNVNGQPWAINSGNAISKLGFHVGNYGGYPITLVESENKERANMRWVQAVSELEQFSTPNFVGNVVRTGNLNGNGTCATFQFTIGYEHPDQVVTTALRTEPDAGNLLVGTAAVKRAVARAMVASMVSNRKVFDPTLSAYGAFANRPNAARIEQITAAGVDTVTNIITVEQNITVTQVSGV
jgi:hypothetical protein